MMRAHRITPLSLAVLFTLVPRVLADDEPLPRADRDQTNQALRQVNDLGKQFRRLGDWSAQADLIDQFFDKVYEANGWDTDFDRFALDLNHEIVRIPPWMIRQRLSKMGEMVAKRYNLDTAQKVRLEAHLFAETVGLIAQNAGVITQHVGEFVSARAQNQPFTPDEVRRWTTESEPLFNDALERMDRVTGAMERTMDERQRQLFERDTQALDRHMKFIVKRREAWARGEWKPEDWGLENDPIQTGKAAAEKPPDKPDPKAVSRPSEDAAAARERTAAAALKSYQAENETTWERYVRLFIAQHGLDAAQQQAIQSILNELQARAAQYRRAHAEELNVVPQPQRGESPAYQPLRDMFDELQRRSEALLTQSQRTVSQGVESRDAGAVGPLVGPADRP